MENNTAKITLNINGNEVNLQFPSNKANNIDFPKVFSVLEHIISGDNNTSKDNVVSIAKSNALQKPAKRNDDFHIRERIPNNAVDIKDLTIGKATTEDTLVRCPKCGQAHSVIVNSNNNLIFLERDYKENTFKVIVSDFTQNDIQGLSYNEHHKTELDYFNDIQKLLKHDNEDMDFVVNNDTEMFCPVCKQSSPFIDWKDAFINPLNFFETEHICDVCGGEMNTIVVKGKNEKKINKCEKCGYKEDIKNE